jgi:hypothetical protein
MVFKFNRTGYPSGYAFGYDPTGRCHKKEFLLKFGRDRRCYLQRLFKAKNSIRGRIGKGHTGKIVIMRRLWKQKRIAACPVKSWWYI